jgi:predicted Zn-dependent protease with MMP-like domain
VSTDRVEEATPAAVEAIPAGFQPHLEDSRNVKVTSDQFERAVQQAIDSIPERFRPYMDDIEFVIAARSPDGLLGYYEGSGALEEDGLPARVTIFKATHERACDTWEDLVEEVRRTVLHEVGHHFLMEEEEMPY